MLSETGNYPNRSSLHSGTVSDADVPLAKTGLAETGETAVRVRNLSKCYQIYDKPHDRLKQSLYPRLSRLFGKEARRYHREHWALKDISFEVKQGETFGIIGRNGSGKSTLLQIIAGTLAESSGSLEVFGRVAALLELGSGFNPEFSGSENVHLNGRILGLSPQEIESRYDRIVEFAEIGEYIDQPVKTYSSGMFLRLAFAVQAHIDASIVIIDEALAVGDVFFRQKCYARLEQLRKSGAAILLVSHSMPDIEQYCNRTLLLDSGMQRFIGPATEATKHYYLIQQIGGKKKGSKLFTANHSSDKKVDKIDIIRPPVEAFFDISEKAQVNHRRAVCTGVALCNLDGLPCQSFKQGDSAIFYYEFELNDRIGVPICGTVISNDRGIIVFGKNSLQYDDADPKAVRDRSKVICQHELKLDLAFGEYVFEIGLASLPLETWEKRKNISYMELSSLAVRLCQIPNVGFFSIGPRTVNGVPVLHHHGIANLPGKMKIVSCESSDFFRADIL
jgi:lipopolysaccharide transport system ATP-binding protein